MLVLVTFGNKERYPVRTKFEIEFYGTRRLVKN